MKVNQVAVSLLCVLGLGLVENVAASSNHDHLLYERLLSLKDKTKSSDDHLAHPIEVTGDHAFHPPGEGDQRGPCPGLNALANHGYISRDGVVSMFEVIDAVHTVYGMGTDLITILATMGTLFAGNPVSLHPGFSLGGPTPKSSNLLGNLAGLLGSPQGLDFAHNSVESDSSATRDDLYVTGDAHTMNMTLFNVMADASEANGGHLTMDDLLKRAAERFDESIALNPYFYYGPFTGMIFRNAGYFFTGRLLANHTTEYPDGGFMTTNVLKSFFAVTEDGQTYTKGHERIPDNWYRTSTDYGLAQLNLDLISMVKSYPVLGSIGGNTAGVNTFSGVNLEDVSGGVMNSATLLDGNNLLCFMLQVVDTFGPDAMSGLFKTLDAPLKLLGAALNPISTLGCPAMGDLSMGGKDLWNGLLDKYPGARKSGVAM